MTMPNFLIIGTAKAGTTSLHGYLKQHPQIYMSPAKEPKFFAFEGEKLDFREPGDAKEPESIVTNIEAYRALFREVADEVAIGEASTVYLYSSKAPERIKYYIPNVKIITILRDPVERAYSNFLHLVNQGREPLTDFAQAIEKEEERILNNWWVFWHYRQRGLYSVQLKRYFDLFDKSQIKVYLYEDFQTDATKMLKDIFRFLEVDEAFIPNLSEKVRQSRRVPKNKVLHALLTQPNLVKSILKPLFPTGMRQQVATSLKNKNLVKPKLTPEVRRQLVENYREDILKLQDLIQRDLSKWLKC